MDNKKVIAVAAVIGVAMLSWLQTGGNTDSPHAAVPTGQPQSSAMAHTDKTHHHAAEANTPAVMIHDQPSPFVGGSMVGPMVDAKGPLETPVAAPEKEVISPEEAARRKKMAALGYMVPPAYYSKNLATLKEMARQGDAYALVHLGEKFYFELNGQKNNPEYDPAMDYPAAAKKSFSEALAAGNIRSAGIISELYLQENNVVDAYAWHLLSKKLGDSISAEWFEKTAAHASLSEQQKQQALAKLPDLMSNINNLSAKYKTRPVF